MCRQRPWQRRFSRLRTLGERVEGSGNRPAVRGCCAGAGSVCVERLPQERLAQAAARPLLPRYAAVRAQLRPLLPVVRLRLASCAPPLPDETLGAGSATRSDSGTTVTSCSLRCSSPRAACSSWRRRLPSPTPPGSTIAAGPPRGGRAQGIRQQRARLWVARAGLMRHRWRWAGWRRYAAPPPERACSWASSRPHTSGTSARAQRQRTSRGSGCRMSSHDGAAAGRLAASLRHRTARARRLGYASAAGHTTGAGSWPSAVGSPLPAR